MTRADDLVVDLADLYEWNITPGAHLALTQAFRGFTRAEVSLVADTLKRTDPPVTPTRLAAALKAAARAASGRGPDPDPLDTVGLTTHPADCRCGGTGLLIEEGLALVDPDSGERLSSRAFRSSKPCPANGGRRMTREQHARQEADQRARDSAAGRTTDPSDRFRAGLGRARAALNQQTTDQEDHDHDPPPAA